jgi:Rab-GTPase-TBC domain
MIFFNLLLKYIKASLRQTAWPLLVGLTDRYSLHPFHWKYTNYFHYIQKLRSYPSNTLSVLSDRDRDLMRRDSTRSVLCRYYTNEFSLELLHQESQQKILSKKSQELCQVLEMVFEKPTVLGSIHYFQGLHDIAAVMLYNLDDTILTSRILERLCRSHFRETLKDDKFVALKSFLDATLLPLLKKFDTGLYDILSPDEVMLPNIILPWILTWCLHDLENPIIASRLMDALFCGHSTFILYLVVALLMAGRNQILNCSINDDEDCHINVIMTIKGMTSMLVSDYTESTEGKIQIQSLIDDALTIV